MRIGKRIPVNIAACPCKISAAAEKRKEKNNGKKHKPFFCPRLEQGLLEVRDSHAVNQALMYGFHAESGKVFFDNSDHLSHILKTLARIRPDHFSDQRGDYRRYIRIYFPCLNEPSFLDHHDGIRGEISREGFFTGHHFIEHDAHRVDVGPLVHVLAVFELFRRHV